MILSRLLRESEDRHENTRNIYSDTHDILTKLAEATSTEGVIGEELQAVLNNFKSKSPKKKDEETSQISFTFPAKTVEEAEAENHHRKLSESLKFKQAYEEWNDRLYQAHNNAPAAEPRPPGEEDIIQVANTIRLPESKPWYMAPPDTVIRIGDSHYEVKVEKKYNEEQGHDEWEKVGLEILERPSGNKVDQEDASVLMDPTNKKIVDWEATLGRIKRLGERLGYSKLHFLECITRLLNEHEPEKYDIFKEETDPNKLVQTLLAKYRALNKRKIMENKIKHLKRAKDQSLLEFMSQVDALADKMLERCKDTKEKDYRKYTIMLDAVKAFTSEKNALELSKYLREASLKGERPNITTIVEMVDQAERIDESTKPNKEMSYEQNIAGSTTAELFTFGMQERDRKGDYKPNRERSAENRKAIQDITDTLSKMRASDSGRGNQDRRGRDSSKEQESRRRRDRSFSRDRRESSERRQDNKDYYRAQNKSRTPERNTRQNPSDKYRDNYREKGRFNRERERNSTRDQERDRYRNRSRDEYRNSESDRRRREGSQTRKEDRRDRSYSRDNRQGYNDRYLRNRSRDNYRSSYSRDNSRDRRDLGSREREMRRSSRDRYHQRASIPPHKKNLAGVEFPPINQMDLSTKFCVKCNNIIEPHYPWDCKLFRYWNSNPCDICYNGNHRSKECRKNPSRVDAFYAMVQDQANLVQNQPESQTPYFTPSN